MSNIKVLLANRPRMHREMVAELVREQLDMEMKGEVLDPVELLLAVAETRADVVVLDLPQPDKEPGICSHLLAEYPDLLILALASDLDSGFLYQRALGKTQLPQVSQKEILAAIRKADVF